MDDDVEIIEHYIEDHPHTEVITDFSQVIIEVHGADVAERIIENLVEDTEEQEYDTEAHNCLEADTEDDIQAILEDSEDRGDYPIADTEDDIEAIVDDDEDHGDYSIADTVNYIQDDTDDLEQIPEDASYENIDEDMVEDYSEQMEQGVEAMSEDQDQSEQYHDYANVQIKEEIEQFEETDFTDIDVEEQPYDNDLPPEDIYHFNNKIILGSKPCHGTPERLQEIEASPSSVSSAIYESDVRKEHLNAVVLLEDWGHHLGQSSSFCRKCDILFATPNALDSHNMTNHSFLVAVNKNVALKSTARQAVARKSTGALTAKSKHNIAKKRTGSNDVPISTFCHHCNKVFADHTALIKHLYNLLPLKHLSCKICDAVFKTQKELIDHNVSHVKYENPRIKKEVVKQATVLKTKLLYEEDIRKKQPVPQKKIGIVIPLSVLFQCTKCNVHLLTPFAGMQHFINCHPDTTFRKFVGCKICKRKLREMDVVTHRKQHELCSKFKVYKVTKNLFERTLCKCPKCSVHFNDYTFKPHLKKCGNIPTAHCQKCNILLPKIKIESHSKKHTKQNMKRKDFIIVNYFIQTKSTLKRKLEPIVTPMKKLKLNHPSNKELFADKNLTVAKIKKEPTNKTAIVSGNKKIADKTKMVNRLKFEKGYKTKVYICKHCNSCCVRDSQRSIHLSKRCTFIRPSERIICQECGLQFNPKTIQSHKRLHRRRNLTIHDMVFYHIGTKKPVVPSMPVYPQCNDCKITFFSKFVQKEHICGENYETCNVCGEKFDSSAYNVHIEFHKLTKSELPTPKIVPKLMPQLMKKYESLNMMWNIVYCCSKCDIVTDLYDKAVEHSQLHLNNEATTKNIKCYICNLKFDESCWSKHSDLHSRMKINSKDFKILSYGPHKLLSEVWFQLFDTLSEEQISQITDGSLYGYERGAKMKLMKDGCSEFTVYCCSNCKVSYQNSDIANHMQVICSKPGNYCKICNIPFSDGDFLSLHESLHLNGIKKEEIRLVSFHKTSASVETQSSFMFMLFKCKVCGICLFHRQNTVRHKCTTEGRRVKCYKCKQSFLSSNTKKHQLLHKTNPDFITKNIGIELFDPPTDDINDDGDDEVIEPKRKKYKSRKNLKGKKILTSKVAKFKTKLAKIEMKTAKVFKCKCGLHYTSIKTIEKHVQTCLEDSNISKEHCSKCGLLFPTDVLVSHLCKHHSKNTKIIVELYSDPEQPEPSFDSVESTSETATQEKKGKTGSSRKDNPKSTTQNCNIKVYKCSECNIYFVTQNTCYKHVYKSHRPIDPRHHIECKLCGLQFTIQSLSAHITKHHQEEFSLDKVLVEEYHPPLEKGPPKIDIYIAAEKVQSLQVTSSIEERITSS